MVSQHRIDSPGALEDQLVTGLRALEASPTVVTSIAGWDWIINCFSNGIKTRHIAITSDFASGPYYLAASAAM